VGDVMNGMNLDMSEFLSELDNISANEMPKAGLLGVYRAASELKIDADKLYPKTPHDTGRLRGDTGRDAWIEQGTIGDIHAVVVYNAPYAHRWHECGPEGETGEPEPNWSDKTGIGPKFLEKKMANPELRAKYARIIAETIREAGSA